MIVSQGNEFCEPQILLGHALLDRENLNTIIFYSLILKHF